ncbi:MAG: ABC transporter permease, partial [Candidatus Limnocylindrales bacterium]
MRGRDVLGQAWLGARTRPGRALLSAIGVAIGVAAIVGVTGISASSRADLVARLDRLGTNLLVLGPGQSITGREVQLSPIVPRMIRRIPPVLAVAATGAVHQANVRRSPYVPAIEGGGIGIIAAEPSLPSTLGVTLRSGTFLNAATASYPVTVLGAVAARHLGIDRADGRQVWIDDRPYVVIGVLDPIALVPDLDRSVFVGWPNAMAALGFDGNPTSIYLRSAVDQVVAVRGILARTADPAHPEDVQVSRPSDALAARAAANDTLTQLLIGLGLVALLVAGVGIANVLLIGVLERRVEIGLRRALGATPR